MYNNDNAIKNVCCASELEKILSGKGNSPQSRLDLPSCDEKDSNYGIKGYPLAMVYSPMQEFTDLYELDKGFNAGTIFSELDKGFNAGTIFSELDLPFKGRSLSRKGNIGGCYDK